MFRAPLFTELKAKFCFFLPANVLKAILETEKWSKVAVVLWLKKDKRVTGTSKEAQWHMTVSQIFSMETRVQGGPSSIHPLIHLFIESQMTTYQVCSKFQNLEEQSWTEGTYRSTVASNNEFIDT